MHAKTTTIMSQKTQAQKFCSLLLLGRFQDTLNWKSSFQEALGFVVAYFSPLPQ